MVLERLPGVAVSFRYSLYCQHTTHEEGIGCANCGKKGYIKDEQAHSSLGHKTHKKTRDSFRFTRPPPSTLPSPPSPPPQPPDRIQQILTSYLMERSPSQILTSHLMARPPSLGSPHFIFQSREQNNMTLHLKPQCSKCRDHGITACLHRRIHLKALELSCHSLVPPPRPPFLPSTQPQTGCEEGGIPKHTHTQNIHLSFESEKLLWNLTKATQRQLCFFIRRVEGLPYCPSNTHAAIHPFYVILVWERQYRKMKTKEDKHETRDSEPYNKYKKKKMLYQEIYHILNTRCASWTSWHGLFPVEAPLAWNSGIELRPSVLLPMHTIHPLNSFSAAKRKKEQAARRYKSANLGRPVGETLHAYMELEATKPPIVPQAGTAAAGSCKT